MFELSLENEFGTTVNINDQVKYLVLNVSGLTPPQATIFTSSSPNKKGSKYNGSTIEERTITLEIKLLGDIEANRNALYEWLTTGQYIKMYYRNGVRNVYCEGYIEVSEANLFSGNELVSVSVTCPDIYFKDLQEIVTEITYLLKQFTFPFAIGDEGVPFSTIKDNVNTTIYNSGNETGLLFTARFTSDVTGFAIENAMDVTQKIQFKESFHFSNGDILLIDTDASPKTIKRINSLGETENILKYVEGRPFWFILKKGNNNFTYISSNNSAIELTISFTNKYLGV